MIVRYILEVLRFGVNWVFSVKEKNVNNNLGFWLVPFMEMWKCRTESVWGEKMMFHFDVHLRCLLQVSRNEQANGQTDLELRGMSGLHVQI